MALKDDFKNLTPSKAAMLGFLAAVIYYFLIFDKGEVLIQETEQLRVEINKKNVRLQEVRSIMEDQVAFKAEVDRLSESIEQLLKYFPVDLDIHNTSSKITSRLEEHNNQVLEVKAAPMKPRFAGYDEKGLEVEANGNFHGVMEFLASLTQLDKVVDFKDLELNGEKSSDDFSSIHMKLLLSVFGKVEGKEQ